jgi:hypothetical protein
MQICGAGGHSITIRDQIGGVLLGCISSNDIDDAITVDGLNDADPKFLGGHRKPAIRGHFKTGHREAA